MSFVCCLKTEVYYAGSSDNGDDKKANELRWKSVDIIFLSNYADFDMTLKIALFHELPIIFLFACRLCFEFSTRRHVQNSRRSEDECCRLNSQDGNVEMKEFQIFLLVEWLYPNHRMQPTPYLKMHSEVRRLVRN